MPDDAPKVPAAPPPSAASPPVVAPAPAAQVNVAVPGAVPVSGLTAAEEAQLGALIAKRDAAEAGGVALLKVEQPHTEMIFGGTRVGTDWTPVPERLVPHLFNAAADAGVTISRQET